MLAFSSHLSNVSTVPCETQKLVFENSDAGKYKVHKFLLIYTNGCKRCSYYKHFMMTMNSCLTEMLLFLDDRSYF